MPALPASLRSFERVTLPIAASPPRHESQVLPVVDRAALAASTLEEAEKLLARGDLEHAGERFQAAARAYDEIGDPAGGARALLGLGKVLLGLEDPVCREVLEDAGTWLEDLGDDAGVRAVDKLLRVAEASIDESPRTFHPPSQSLRASSGHMRISSAPPPRSEE